MVFNLRYRADTVWSDGTTTDKTYAYTIQPRRVAIPAAPANLLYNGTEQTVDIATDSAYVIQGNVAKDVGTYQATVSLIDTANYVWENGMTADRIYTYSVYSLALNVSGENTATTTYTLGDELPLPYRDGYDFKGWYANPSFSGNAVTSLEEISANTVLYAKWEESRSSGTISVDPQKQNAGGVSTKVIIGIAIAGGALFLAILIIVIGSIFKRGGKGGGRPSSFI